MQTKLTCLVYIGDHVKNNKSNMSKVNKYDTVANWLKLKNDT